MPGPSSRFVLALLLLVVVGPAAARGAVSGEPESVAGGLVAPWEVVLVPDGRTWVGERPCRVRSVEADGALRTIFTDPTQGITCRKFLGLVLHPRFAENRFAYLYETYTAGDGAHRSRVLRLVDSGGALGLSKVLLDGIDSDLSHDGGRMIFGPDGHLYVTTGDIHDRARPQDVRSLNGKVLRLMAAGDARDGEPAPDNPFAGSGGAARYVWTYGHRHPQGLAFDALGRLWESEHGPSGEGPEGAECCRDEINLLVRGGNYGWPLVAGDQSAPGTIAPAAHSGTDTWAPGGAVVGSDGVLYVPGLRGQSVRAYPLSCSGLGTAQILFSGSVRYRAAASGRGALWYTTDAQKPADRVMRVGLTGSDPLRGVTCPAVDGRAQEPAPASAPGGTAATGSQTVGPAPVRWNDRPLRRLVARVRRSRSGRVTTYAGGFGPGRLVVRVGTGRRVIRTRSRAVIRFSVRAPRARRFALRLTFTPVGGRAVTRRAVVRPRVARGAQ